LPTKSSQPEAELLNFHLRQLKAQVSFILSNTLIHSPLNRQQTIVFMQQPLEHITNKLHF